MKNKKNLEKENKKLVEENKKLKDEVDSLWAMMDEMDISDINNWKYLWDDIEKDVAIRTLMISKKKVDA